MELSGQLHVLAALPPQVTVPPALNEYSRPGTYEEDKNLLPLKGFESWTVQLVASSLHYCQFVNE